MPFNSKLLPFALISLTLPEIGVFTSPPDNLRRNHQSRRSHPAHQSRHRQRPLAINNTGIVVGQTGDNQAFRWENGTLMPLGTLGGTHSAATAVNDSVVIVGWSFDANHQQKAFKWAGALTSLESNAQSESSAEAINASGEIVGWRTTIPLFDPPAGTRRIPVGNSSLVTILVLTRHWESTIEEKLSA